MNIERTKINMTRLRQNTDFRAFVELMQAELAEARVTYETTAPASEFLRGKVIALREIVDELTRPTSGR